MFLKKTPTSRGLYLAITESYYDKNKKCTRQKTIEGLGYLDELTSLYPDPIAHFEQVIAERNNERKTNSAVPISIDLSASMDEKEDSLKNVGYGIFKQLYKDL